MSKFRNEINHILLSIRRGDNSKKQLLCEKTYNHLKVIALKYAARKEDYEDILLEAYIRIFQYIKSVDFNKDGYNWMCKIVQNVAYDFNKSLSPSESAISENEGFYFLDDILENRNILYEIMKNLSLHDQKLLYLRFWEGLSYSEIAKEVNGKKSSVHKHILILIEKINQNLKK